VLRILLAGLAAAVMMGAVRADATILNEWVQMAPNNMALIRVIDDNTPGDSCPVASLDGTPVTLTARFAPSTTTPYDFPILMCEASVTALGHTSVVINGVTLKMPVSNPQRILFIGDTGCRVQATAAKTQACNDPTQFPLQYIANYAATFKPDLIVHVGDFYYREFACPATANCSGSPTGDHWASWNADFFAPAANLLLAAPLAISRGNHESCSRGAHGWFSLLDPHPYDSSAVNCTGPYVSGNALTYHDYTDPYIVPAGQVSLLMFDSSDSNTSAPDLATMSSATDPNDTAFPPTLGLTIPQIYTQQLSTILATVPSGTKLIYVTHKSTYDVRPASTTTNAAYTTAANNGWLAGGDSTQQSVFAAFGGVPAPIVLLVAGHDHQLQVVNFNNSSAFAPQLVVGNSGTLLDNNSGSGATVQTFTPDTSGSNAGATYALTGVVGEPTVQVTQTVDQAVYGFTILTATSTGYLANVYNLSSSKLARCSITLSPRSMACAQ